MDLDRMLEKCERDQWRVSDLDWSVKPRALDRDDEIAIVQLFTDMAGIERLAGALFAEQRRRVTDPRLKKIFESFVVDEVRHAQAAEKLAAHYDVHKYRDYQMNPSLVAFAPHFVKAIRYLADDVANTYILAGELILDVALLRSIDDYVADSMSAQAMKLINRDESRHIAIDYHMVEYYASPAYDEALKLRPKTSLKTKLEAWWTFANVLYYASPFIRAVFTEPMDRVDKSGRRMREAFKRMQLLGFKPGVTDRPFARFMTTLQVLYNKPLVGKIFGGALSRLAGLDPRFMQVLYDEHEAERARQMSFDEHAEDALAVKYAGA